MEPQESTVCPVCTLYLRPGITLANHLSSHPKQKVIEALVKISSGGNLNVDVINESPPSASSALVQQIWSPENSNQSLPVTNSNGGNHVFIYHQQSMSTAQTSPMTQYIVPAVSQMVPYVYQQQQVIMSSGPCVPQMRVMPFDIPCAAPSDDISNAIVSSSQIKGDIIEIVNDINEPSTSKEKDAEKTENIESINCDEKINEFEDQDVTVNKACQTPENPTNKKEYFYENYSGSSISDNYQQGAIFVNSDVLSNEPMQYVEMQNIPIVLDNFRPNDLNPIEITEQSNVKHESRENLNDLEESTSRGSLNVNIRADERMPPRGELSEQESLGGVSDIAWNRYETSNGASYDLMARETWDETSGEMDNNDRDSPTVVSFTAPPFKCSTCGEAFSCARDRKKHDQTRHKKLSILKNIKFIKEKTKKMVADLKKQNNFDAVFNQLFDDDKIKREEEPGRFEDVKVKEENSDLRTVCSTCNEILPNPKALKKHKTEVHNIPANIKFSCGVCSETFMLEYKYTEHLKVHPLECKMCGKLFYRRQNMQLHMKRHLGIKPYKCETCDKRFLTKQKLDEHVNTHTGNSPIKCGSCDETFRRYSNLVQHRNRYHLKIKKKQKDFLCFCGEFFHSKKKLAWHKETHDPIPKACTKCSEKFIHMSSLTRHIRQMHNDWLTLDDAENAECPICKKVYLRSSLDTHIKSHSGNRPFTCTICKREFTTQWNLKLHRWTHEARTNKPFKCDQCQGAFIRQSDFVAHMNSHKSIRPYTCNYCGAKFIRKYNCQRHVKEHENEKTFTCTVCGKSFHRSYYLKDHMRMHSGLRPYTCHVCGKTSTTKSNHNKHVAIHHAREPLNTEN